MKCFSVALQIAYHAKSRHRAGLKFIRDARSGLEIIKPVVGIEVQHPGWGVDNHTPVT